MNLKFKFNGFYFLFLFFILFIYLFYFILFIIIIIIYFFFRCGKQNMLFYFKIMETYSIIQIRSKRDKILINLKLKSTSKQ